MDFESRSFSCFSGDLQQGPSVAEMMASLGPAESSQRFHKVLLLLAESDEQAPRHAAGVTQE